MPAGNYRNPPIEEAICEFLFASSPQQGIDFALPGKLQSHPKLKDIYQGAVRAQNLQTVIGGEGPLAIQTALHRIQLPSRDEKRIIAIGPNSISVSTLKPYDGWANFKPRIADVITAIFEIVGNTTIVRIGLRYINRIVVTQGGRVGDYLVGVPPHYPSLRGELTSFLYRSEYLCEDKSKVIINQGSLHPSTPGASEFLLDIDVLRENAEFRDVGELMQEADRLHALEGGVFEGLITEQSRRLFDDV